MDQHPSVYRINKIVRRDCLIFVEAVVRKPTKIPTEFNYVVEEYEWSDFSELRGAAEMLECDSKGLFSWVSALWHKLEDIRTSDPEILSHQPEEDLRITPAAQSSSEKGQSHSSQVVAPWFFGCLGWSD